MDVKSLLERLAGSPDLAPCRELVEPLEAYDRERGSDLVRTLRVYFEAGANASEAANRLFLHRNSMHYRLKRVQVLTGVDPKEPEARLALHLGLLTISRHPGTTEVRGPSSRPENGTHRATTKGA